jgi:hypothetical protein
VLNIKLIKIASLALVVSLPLMAAAQTKLQPVAPGSSVVAPQEIQWEYLVVSYGKTLFGSPEKTLAYRSIGLAATAQEANEIQQSLDILGRFGWEVITVVGSIGGDQQIVLKRRYEKAKVANEGLAILRGRELYLKDLIDILERGRKIREESEAAAVAARNQPRLVDLDAKESEEKRMQLTAELNAKVKSALNEIQGAKDPSVSARVLDSAGKYSYVDIKIDLTDLMLKDGGNYRASEVRNWLNSTLIPTLKRAFNSVSGSLDITVTANINFNGKVEKVGEQKTRYSDILKRWTE